MSYDYDKFGNLASRKDNLRNLEETFLYDNMNRLTDIYLGNTHSQIVYDPLGRMTDKEADGQTVFANADFTAAPGQPTRPHAMTGAETTEYAFPAATQSIGYTSFDKVKAIVEDDNYIIYTYGYDQQRIHMTESVDGVIRLKEYVGMCEFITDDYANSPALRSLTYLVGPYGVFAAVEKRGSAETVHYILKDHLGSWTTITDAEGVVEQELNFDAWGELRDPETWSGGFSDPLMFDRGFTGHEHLTAFGLVNMNGRCYDPLTSHFLSVDAYVQDPTSAQAFNRYAYCAHNPLRYTDPTGWLCGNPSPIRQSNRANYNAETTWHSNDIDMLWGRSLYPCETSDPERVITTSSGYMVGNALVTGNAPLSQIQAIRAYQNNPNILTSMMLENMGIDVTIGCTNGSYSGIEGFRSSEYNWTDATGQSYNANAFEYIGGNENGYYITGNEPSKNFWNDNLRILLPQSHETSSNQEAIELQLNSTNSFVYDDHWKSTPMKHTMQGGQHVKAVVTNINIIGVTLQLQDVSTYYYDGWLNGIKYSGDAHTFLLMPGCSTSFDFYRFVDYPYTWAFELSTNSNAANVIVKFYSDWIPGMPSSRNFTMPIPYYEIYKNSKR